MKKEPPQQRLEVFARAELDRSIQDLDAATLARLRTIRNDAVRISQRQDRSKKTQRKSTGNNPGIFTAGNWWLPVGGFAATAAVVALSLSLWMVEPSLATFEHFEDIAVLSANEDLDLFDDLEFYQWLDDETQNNS